MESTSASLLERLRHPEDPAAWSRLVELYTPLLFHWAQRLGLQSADAADLVQDVFVLLVRKLPEFRYDPQQSFRAWLRIVTINKWRERCRARAPVTADRNWGELPERSSIEDDQEDRRILTHRALALIETEFSPVLWQAFQQYALAGRHPQEVAQELGIAPGTVYSIKSKVLHRLRQELQDLLD
jgi:RNA polymerase sigma-70 factor (ECF subfamily)